MALKTLFGQQGIDGIQTDSSTTQTNDLGTVIWVINDSTGNLQAYKYVQAAADTTVANGTVLTYTSSAQTIVTSDISDTNPNFVAGVGVGAIAASSFGWIQVYGFHSAVATDGGDDIAAGDALIVDPTVDGVCDSVAAGTAPTHKTLGFAQAADVDGSNTVAAFLNCL